MAKAGQTHWLATGTKRAQNGRRQLPWPRGRGMFAYTSESLRRHFAHQWSAHGRRSKTESSEHGTVTAAMGCALKGGDMQW